MSELKVTVPTPILSPPYPFSNTVHLGPVPANVRCIHCQHDVLTSTRKMTSNTAHFTALVMCIFGCCLCAFIPYMMDSLKEVHHNCPNCQAFLGVFKRT